MPLELILATESTDERIARTRPPITSLRKRRSPGRIDPDPFLSSPAPHHRSARGLLRARPESTQSRSSFEETMVWGAPGRSVHARTRRSRPSPLALAGAHVDLASSDVREEARQRSIWVSVGNRWPCSPNTGMRRRATRSYRTSGRRRHSGRPPRRWRTPRRCRGHCRSPGRCGTSRRGGTTLHGRSRCSE